MSIINMKKELRKEANKYAENLKKEILLEVSKLLEEADARARALEFRVEKLEKYISESNCSLSVDMTGIIDNSFSLEDGV